MKLTDIIYLAAIAAFTTSCESTGNKNHEPELRLPEAVSGTYTGYSTAEFQYSSTPMVSKNQTLTVSAENDKTVSVSYTSDTWGTFSLTGVTVNKKEDGTYSLNGNGKAVMGMSADSQSEYDCSLTAGISGSEDFSFNFDIPAVMGGLKITILPGNPPADLLIRGTYTGTLTVSVMGTAADPIENAQVTLAANEDTWTLTLPEMGIGSMTIDPISVVVQMAESNDGYTLTAENIGAVSGETNITGSLTGTVSNDGNTMTLSAEITPGAMPMAINVNFEGTK